ncbi:MAG TPA: GAF domain-containing protein [Pyrinomonadaceae bacterium]|nr:GAF domain-containing protein [Pyrinomonadaceae bacterium]
MSDSYESDLPAKLQRLIETIDIANVLTDPLTRSIEDLLRATAADIKSEEASVLIRDGDEGDLRFLSAIGKVAERLIDMRVPAGKGIAGFVLSSGQPMAVSNVEQDDAFYAEVDKATGYSTETILATPLRYEGEVIGVLEYINRSGDPPYEAFTPDEMDRAARFADAIASLVHAYESAKLFRDMSQMIIGGESEFDVSEVRDWLAGFRGGAEHKEMMDLAVIVREIAGRGEAERRMCREVLDAMLKYTDDKTETSFLSY